VTISSQKKLNKHSHEALFLSSLFLEKTKTHRPDTASKIFNFYGVAYRPRSESYISSSFTIFQSSLPIRSVPHPFTNGYPDLIELLLRYEISVLK
jgi:hypothetical protein